MFCFNGKNYELRSSAELSLAFLWIFNYMHMCRCLLMCLFSELTYTLHTSIFLNCGVGRNGYWFMCGVVSLCMCMINHSLPGSTDFLFFHLPTCLVMSSCCFFFPFSHHPPQPPNPPPFSHPCILLACNNLPWTPTPIIPSSFPLKPSKNNKHSLKTLSR